MPAAPDAKLTWIDQLRGVAVTLVIASHAMPVLPLLPWAVKRVSNLGFFGVQLFFVVSCFTLARSWHGVGRGRDRGSGRAPDLVGFFRRRLFRIAPAYWGAACVYAVLWPHPPVSPGRLASFLTFTGGWSPRLMPTVPGAWVGVPGGWSIEVEMAFYALFPLLMRAVRGPAAALAALLASLPLAAAADLWAARSYGPVYGAAATDQFLYYWLPNQLPVFLVGLLVFELSRPGTRRLASPRMASLALAGAAVGFLALAFVRLPRLPEPAFGFLHTPVLAGLCFGAAALAMEAHPPALPGGRVLARLGEASFSAYLLHFAVIDAVRRLLPASVLGLTDVPACLASAALFAAVLAATGLLSRVVFGAVERPGMRLGERLGALAKR